MCKKTYYYWEKSQIKYGQNNNGPPAWRMFVEFFDKQSHLKFKNDIITAFCNFFNYCYDTLQLTDYSQEIKIKSEYKTKTPAHELQQYLQVKHPALAGAFKQQVYYFLNSHDVTKTTLRPSIELVDIKNVNLFKFFYNNHKTVANLIKHHITKNQHPYSVNVPLDFIRTSFLSAFIQIYNERFPKTSNATSIVWYLPVKFMEEDDDEENSEKIIDYDDDA